MSCLRSKSAGSGRARARLRRHLRSHRCSLSHSARVHSALLRADPPSLSSPTDRPHPPDCPTTAVHHRRRLRGMSYAPLKRTALPRTYTTYPSRLRLSRRSPPSVCEVWIHAAVFDIYIKICLRFAGRRFVDPDYLTFAHKYSSVSGKIRIDFPIK